MKYAISLLLLGGLLLWMGCDHDSDGGRHDWAHRTHHEDSDE